MPGLSYVFHKAQDDAFFLHGSVERKGDKTPYYAHLMLVAGTVMDHGGDETTAIAGMFHDAIEDTEEGLETVKTYGSEVLGIVLECSDTITRPKPPWKNRKEDHLEEILAGKKCDASMVVLSADTYCNVISMIRGYRKFGEGMFEGGKFRGGKDGLMWYYRAKAEALNRVRPSDSTLELCEAVTKLETVFMGG